MGLAVKKNCPKGKVGNYLLGNCRTASRTWDSAQNLWLFTKWSAEQVARCFVWLDFVLGCLQGHRCHHLPSVALCPFLGHPDKGGFFFISAELCLVLDLEIRTCLLDVLDLACGLQLEFPNPDMAEDVTIFRWRSFGGLALQWRKEHGQLQEAYVLPLKQNC